MFLQPVLCRYTGKKIKKKEKKKALFLAVGKSACLDEN